MALTERYVKTVAAGAEDGTSEANCFSFAQMVTDINTGAPAGKRYNIKAGTAYDLSAGAVTLSGTGPYILQGYTTTIGDAANDPSKRAILSNGTATTDMVTASGVQAMFRDLVFASTATTGNADGLRLTNVGALVERCTAYGWRDNGFDASNTNQTFIECESYDCNKANSAAKSGFYCNSSGGLYVRCVSHDHTGNANSGYVVAGTAGAIFMRCIADTCGLHGFFINNRTFLTTLSHCDAYNNGGSGFNANLASYIPCAYLENCNAVDNAVAGFATGLTTNVMILVNCFDYSNTSGRSSNGGLMLDESSASTYTGLPYTNAASGDFSLDATSGEGAAGRATARGSLMMTSASYGPTASYLDIGAVQHADTAGGGGGPLIGGRLVQ